MEIDKKKANHYYKLAAIGGSIEARHNLGGSETRVGNMNRALKHFMIAAEGRESHSLKALQQLYSKDMQRRMIMPNLYKLIKHT